MSYNTEYGAARANGLADDSYLPPVASSDGSSGAEKKYPDYLEPTTSNRAGSIEQAEAKYKKLSWQKLTVCLIVEAIALGSLSIPGAFATLGMVPGVLLSVGLGLVAIYTSYVVGQVKLRHPQLEHYADAVGLMWGRFGYELTSFMFILSLVVLVGSHTLTGAIAWIKIVSDPTVCALVWSIISAVLLFALALPPTFSEFAILGYIDFISIIVAIIITIIATGVEASQQVGGLTAVTWSLWPSPDATFATAFLAVTNIMFAYSFAICQFSFMCEMHTPRDYVKSIWALGLIEIFIYTVTGALIYRFVGIDVKSPALLSAGGVISRVAFGVALPVIFISGSINATVVARYIINRAFPHSTIKYINTPRAWVIWIALIAGITVIAWVIAEAIPFFSDLIGILSSLFMSGFSFYFPALFWFTLIKEGPWYRGWKNLTLSAMNALAFIIGVVTLGAGTYASVQDIIDQYNKGTVRGSFTCSVADY